ncbi:MAG: AbrB/MazE/SpoVT family DNA-binding domain-containing protein [Bryobacteraceae bacterium]
MTITVKNKAPIVIPSSIQKQAGLKAGDRLEFKVSGKIITVLPKVDDLDDGYTATQRRTIDARLAKADDDILRGRTYGPFSSADEMIVSMKAELRKRLQRTPTRKRPRDLEKSR